MVSKRSAVPARSARQHDPTLCARSILFPRVASISRRVLREAAAVSETTHTSRHAVSARPIGLSRYTFKIAVPHSHGSLGLHVRNIEFVGAQPATVQMVPVKDDGYCVKAGTQSSERSGVRHQHNTLHLADARSGLAQHADDVCM